MGQDLGLAGFERGEHRGNLVVIGLAAQGLERRALGLVLDQVAQGRVAFFADGLVERGRAVRDRLHMHDLRERDLHRHRDLIVVGLAADLGGELVGHAAHLRDAVDHVHRQADRLTIGGQRALDGLFDPPGGVSAELAAFVGIEAFDGLDQAEVAFADEVHQR